MPLTTDAVRIAEDISILYLLHRFAAPATSNPVAPPVDHRANDYVLPFEKERHLTMALAYLSCIKDNYNRVPAVCVREVKAANRLDILIAVNKSIADDAGTLIATQTRFQRVFDVLSSASTSEETIFSEVVSMCSTRIIERLRLAEKGKMSVRMHLSDAVNALAKKSVAFVCGAKDMIHKIDLWTKHRTHSELGKIVDSAHQLSKLPDLPYLLDHISNRDMGPHSRVRLLNEIRKLARYRIAARVLYRSAKNFPIARQMRAVLASLPEVAFQRVQATQQVQNRELSSALSRITLSKNERKKMSHCYRYLGMDEAGASQQFKKQKITTLDEAKIHAEVQLVFYCEVNNFQPPPRVICSSKDACFLCNSLITMQGKYHIPRQHGRLYPNWRLPWFPTSNGIQNRFAKHLEGLISRSIKAMIENESRIKCPQPNESTALTVPISDTTVSVATVAHSLSSSGSSTVREEPQSALEHSPEEAAAPLAATATPDVASIMNIAKEDCEITPKPEKGTDMGEEASLWKSLSKPPSQISSQVLSKSTAEPAAENSHGEPELPPITSPTPIVASIIDIVKQDCEMTPVPEKGTDIGKEEKKQSISSLCKDLSKPSSEISLRVLTEPAPELKAESSPGEPGLPQSTLPTPNVPPIISVVNKDHRMAQVPEKGKNIEGKEEKKSISARWKGLSKPLSKRSPGVLPKRRAEPTAPTRLTQGTTQVITVEANSSAFYKGHSLDLEIEYSNTRPEEKSGAKHLSCTLEHLSTTDAEAIRADKDVVLIDADQLETEVSVPPSPVDKWYFSTKGAVFGVQIT